jgi:hypothetical protein
MSVFKVCYNLFEISRICLKKLVFLHLKEQT